MKQNPTNQQVSPGCMWAIALFIIVAIIIGAFSDDEKPTRHNEETGQEELVYNSSYDGSVSQVKEYLKNNLKDWDSYESVDWSEVVKTGRQDQYYWMVRHKYRAKNSFGGYALENQIFYLDKEGNVTDVDEYTGQ